MTPNYQESPLGIDGWNATLNGSQWFRLKPLSFTGPNAQKCFDGQKTQTRRLLNPQPTDGFIGDGPCQWFHPSKVDKRTGEMFPGVKIFGASDDCQHYKSPFLVGEFFYIREPWRTWQVCDDVKPSLLGDSEKIFYEGSPVGTEVHQPIDAQGKLRPAMFLQRRFARPARYQVIGVRCERVNAITPADAEAEGVVGGHGACDRFGDLWNSINTKPGTRFEDGPWVWAYEFRRVK